MYCFVALRSFSHGITRRNVSSRSSFVPASAPRRENWSAPFCFPNRSNSNSPRTHFALSARCPSWRWWAWEFRCILWYVVLSQRYVRMKLPTHFSEYLSIWWLLLLLLVENRYVTIGLRRTGFASASEHTFTLFFCLTCRRD